MRDHAHVRQAEEALGVVQAIRSAVARGQPADLALQALFRARRHYGSRDRRLFSGLTFAYFRWKGWVDAFPDLPHALAAAAWLDDIATYDLLPRWWPALAALARPASFVECGRCLAQLGAAQSPLSLRSLVPEWFHAQWDEAEQRESLEQFVDSIQRQVPLWLRCRAGALDSVQAALRAARIRATIDSRIPFAIRIESRPSREALKPILHRYAEIQDIASQCVGQLCAARPGERWWDLCAGAGGKALHLLDQLGGSGHLLCTDVRAEALRELDRRARAAGFTNWTAQTIPADPAQWNIDTTFDGILLDAPCTGTGTWGRAPDARWRTSREDCLNHAARQANVLRHALRHLKPGGHLIYAVCSLTHAETRAVIEPFSLQPRLTISPITHPLTGETANSCRILPSQGPGIGMWISKIIHN